MNVFLPTGPAGKDEETLYSTRTEFAQSLQTVSDHILASTGPDRDRSLTFGILGDWGSGKSTALRQIEARLIQDGSVLTGHFDAPQWEPLGDARFSLAYVILQGVSPTLLQQAQKALSEAAGAEETVTAGDWRDLVSAANFFEAVRDSPGAPVIEQWMQRMATERLTEANKRVFVLLIDDLDRCGLDFTSSLLAALNYWDHAGLPLYFIVAARRDHLLDSLRSQSTGAKSPDEALEKYIHVAIDVPAFLTDPTEVAAFLTSLLPAGESQGNNSPLGHVLRLLNDAGRRPSNSVLAPVVRVGEDGLTPRGAKTRMNLLLTYGRELEEAGPTSVDDESFRRVDRIFKDNVLRTYWPEFWNYTYKPVLIGSKENPTWLTRSDFVRKLTELGSVLAPLWNETSGRLDTASAVLELLREHLGSAIDFRGVDLRLAMYLAMDPAWDAQTVGVAVGASAIPDLHASQPGDNVTDSAVGTLPGGDVLLEFWQAESAADSGEYAAARQHLRNLEGLVRADVTNSDGAIVGNAALVAERISDNGLARRLHELAVRGKGGTAKWNIMQNFVDFILDTKDADRYKEAEALLEALRTEGGMHKPERTAALAFRFSNLTGTTIPGFESPSQVISDLQHSPTVEGLTRIVDFYPSAMSSEQLLEIGRTVAAAVTDDSELYRVLRIVADKLAGSSEWSDEAAALDIYGFLLRSGLACSPPRSDTLVVGHNMASLLAGRYRGAAIALWAWIYAQTPNDEKVRRGFGITLGRAGMEGAAVKVIQGREFSEPLPEREDLPVHFSEVDRWWETIDVAEYSPCDVPLDRS